MPQGGYIVGPGVGSFKDPPGVIELTSLDGTETVLVDNGGALLAQATTGLIASAGLFVNVMAFGATGNGVTDDTVAIQNASAAVALRGGGTLYCPFPSVSYRVSALITLPSNTRLLCDPGTIFKPAAATIITGSTQNGSPVVTLATTSGVKLTQTVAGTGIPTNVGALGGPPVVISVGASSITMSDNATATNSNIPITIGAGRFVFSNVNITPDTITDHDIVVEDAGIDWTNYPTGGGRIGFYFRSARNISVLRPRQTGGGDITAMVHTDNTLVDSPYATGIINVGCDHWDSFTNATVRNPNITSAHYGVLFTGANTRVTDAGVSQNAFLEGGTITLTDVNGVGVWVNGLGLDGSGTSGVRIIGTRIISEVGAASAILVSGTGSTDAIIDGAIISGTFLNSPILTGTDPGGTASNTTIGNIIFDGISCAGKSLLTMNCVGDQAHDIKAVSGTYSYVVFLNGTNQIVSTSNILTTGTSGTYNITAGNNNRVIDRVNIFSWTPTLVFGGASTGIIYTSQVGQYWFDGDRINIAFDLGISSKGSATGSAAISGLPFGARASEPAYTALGLSYMANMNGLAVVPSTGPSFVLNPTLTIQPSTLNILVRFSASIADTALQDTNFSNTSILRGGGSYVIG